MSGGRRGRWVVLIMVVAGMVAAAIAYSWWSYQQRRWQAEGVPPRDAAGSASPRVDPEAALEEINAVGNTFTDAVERKMPLESVRQAAQRLVERYPGFSEARNLYGQVLLAMQRRSEAYEQFRLSLGIDARQAEIELLAGTIAEAEGNLDRAIQHYAAANSIAAQNPRYRTFLANAYLSRGDRSKARETLLEALQLDSNYHKAHAVFANFYAEDGKLDMALNFIAKAIDHTPIAERDAQVDYLRLQATLLRRDNRPLESLQILTESLTEAEQAQRKSAEGLAATWGMLGEPAKAAEAWERAWRADPGRLEYGVDAALWRIRAHQPEIARRHLDAIRRVQPNHPGINTILDALRSLSGAARQREDAVATRRRDACSTAGQLDAGRLNVVQQRKHRVETGNLEEKGNVGLATDDGDAALARLDVAQEADEHADARRGQKLDFAQVDDEVMRVVVTRPLHQLDDQLLHVQVRDLRRLDRGDRDAGLLLDLDRRWRHVDSSSLPTGWRAWH